MRWKIPEKICAGVLCVVSVILALAGLLAALHILPPDTVSEFAARTFASSCGRWTVCGICLIMLLAVAGLIAREICVSRLSARSARICTDDSGSTFITIDALERMIRTLCRRDASVKRCSVSADAVEDGINTVIRVSVYPETDIATFGAALQGAVRTAVSDVTGMQVKDIQLLIDQVRPESVKKD